MQFTHSRFPRASLFLVFCALVLTEGCDCSAVLSDEECVYSRRGIGGVGVVKCTSAQDSYEEFWFQVNRFFGIDRPTGKRRISLDPGPTNVGSVGGPPRSEVRVVHRDTLGNVFAGGLFEEAKGTDGTTIAVENIVVWRVQTRAWERLGDGLNGAVTDIATNGDNVYAGGDFGGSGEEVVRLLAHWDGTGMWKTVGQGITGSRIDQLEFDQDGGLIVAGDFTEVVDASGISTAANGIARWDPNAQTWSTYGTGFEFSFFDAILPQPAGKLLISGDLTPLGSTMNSVVMYWDGVSWTPSDSGVSTISGAEIAEDSEGRQYFRYYEQPASFVVAQRDSTHGTWTPFVSDIGITNVEASRESSGAVLSGSFTQLDGKPANGRAFWDGESIEPIPMPGACASLQLIHAIADPSALPVDLVLDDTPIVEDFAFGTATGTMSMTVGQPYKANVLAGGGAAGKWLRRVLTGASGDTLLTYENLVFDDRSCIAAPVGVLSPSQFAENPEARDTSPTLAFAELPSDAGHQIGMASVLLMHGVSDAPSIDVFLDGTRVAEDLAFGNFSEVLTLTPGPYRLILERASDGSELGSYNIDLTGAEESIRTITVTGFLEPGANQNGPEMAVLVVDDAGTITPTNVEPTDPIESVGLALHGNYPNPFADETTITYSLKRSARTTIQLFDLLGRRVKTLVDSRKPPGTHMVTMTKDGLSAGTYVLQLVAGESEMSATVVVTN